MIVDTDVLIDILQDREDARVKVAELESNAVPLRISSISLFELYHSLERVADPASKRQAIDAVLDTKDVYPADSAVMKKAGRIDGRLTEDGEAIGIGDTIIGATGLVHEEPILTRNTDHFKRIDGLDLATY